MFLLVLFLSVLTFYILLIYLRQLNYWRKRGVKYLTPLPFIGNVLPTITQSMSMPEYIIRLYEAFPQERYCGVFQFGLPILLIRDPDLIKTVCIKEFNAFSDHGIDINEDLDPLWAKNLFASQGVKWKNLRHTLTPVFTSRKMKNMFNLMENCTNRFINYLINKNEDIVEFELENLIKRHTMDVIANTAFGIETNSLTNNDDEFFKMGVELTDFNGFKRFKMILYNSLLEKVLNLKMISDHVSSFFHSIVKHTMEMRAKEKIIRPDFLHLIMEARAGRLYIEELGGISTEKEFSMNLTDEDITAQAVLFIFGGFDTTSKLMSFCLYELAKNPNIQERLREEVDENYQKFNGKISYEDLFEMKYLDMVIQETLRIWPVALFLDRKAVSSLTIQPTKENEEPLHIKAGDVCWIPVFALHRDPKYWPNPEIFDPERFNKENREKITPEAFLPFGLGPRNCIGSRYAILEAKLLIFHLLANFEIVPTAKSRIPLVIRKSNIMLTPEHGFWFGFKKRNVNDKYKIN